MNYALTNFARTRKPVDGRDVFKDLNSPDYKDGSRTGSKNKKQGSNSNKDKYQNKDKHSDDDKYQNMDKGSNKTKKTSYSRKSSKDSKIRKRVKSIDVIRGLAIGLMILGNNQAIWQRVYPPLRHAVWNGVTLADFAFPFFVISLGVTIPISIDSRLKRNDPTLRISLSIVRRSVMLILFGVFLNYLKNQDLNTIRILGVLQRMGLVYFVTSFVYFFMRKAKKKDLFIITSMIAISAFIVVEYYFIAKPYGFQMEGSLAQRVDMYFFKGHLYKPEFEPDGFLTSFVAIASGMLGCSMGSIVNNKKLGEYKKFLLILAFGIVMLLLSKYFNNYFPYNKRLWSSSFVLLTAGSYGLLLSILYFICDILKISKIFTPIIALGSSPIFVYVAAESLAILFWYRVVTSSTPPYNSLYYIEDFTYTYITPWAGSTWDSLVFAIGYLIIWMIVMMFIYKKDIVIKI
ncbi:acyltransferase family protein [Metaclostridioides mangenotii]|uniref:acyltransferase family protein n=1 Tax=Metaclostridioides mangenotii TaxID=1540 RepID=UPI0026EADC4E|nr:DUF5009 domain-containing protein [Clostridioides mangenotii]